MANAKADSTCAAANPAHGSGTPHAPTQRITHGHSGGKAHDGRSLR